MKTDKFRISAVFSIVLLLVALAYTTRAQTLGDFQSSSVPVQVGGNTTVTPLSVPSGITRATAKTSTGFKGVLTVNPTTGAVKVINAQPAGLYTVTVAGFSAGGALVTKTFTLRVLRQGCPTFSASNFTDGPGSPFSVDSPQFPSIGDFNNDNQQDVVVVSGLTFGFPNNITRFLGNGNGGFSGASQPAGGTASVSIDTGDFNGDGNADSVTVNSGTGNISILLGDGAGGFSASTIAVGVEPGGVAVGDYNNDNRADIAVVNSGSNSISVLLGAGNGMFTNAAGSPFTVPGGNKLYDLVRGDFNNNGSQDLAVVSRLNSRVYILLGTGTGTFAQAAGSPVIVGTGPLFINLGDFDNNGNQDLLVPNGSGANSVRILLGNGAGGFSVANTIAFNGSPDSSAIADVNADGNQDFLISEYFTNPETRVYLGNGAGGFTLSGTVSGGGSRRGISIGDFNQNGLLDFATVTTSGDDFYTYSGNCTVNINTPDASFHNATLGQFYLKFLTATGGTAPRTFSAIGLPLGLSISSSGTISGTPTQTGTFIVSVFVSDSTPFAPLMSNEDVNFTPQVTQQALKQFQLIVNFAPTAASVDVGGRVLTPTGRGLANARVKMTDVAGSVRTMTTNPFGYYRFAEVAVGQTCIFEVSSKRYEYAPQVVAVLEGLENLDFTANW